MKSASFQDLSRFQLPPGFRGRTALTVQLWWAVEATAFRWSPQFAYRWRAFLLRTFGARIGRGVKIRPTVTVTYPWKLVVGDHAWVGDDAVLYSLGDITIGRNAVVSQKSYVCAADHDAQDPTFAIRTRPVVIGDEAWVAADVFVGPGVTIGTAAVVGARSSVFHDLPPATVCVGTPARPIKPRVYQEGAA